MQIREFMPGSGMFDLRLTDAERRTLTRASAILKEARDKMRAHDSTLDDTDTVTDIAMASYTCADLAETGRISF